MDWTRCTEENYPETDDMGNIIICYMLDDVWTYQTYPYCPYGWNVLCDMKAYWLKLIEPKVN